MTGDSEGGGGGGGGAGEAARCVQCDLEYNRDDRCPRKLLCGHTCCTACLDDLIKREQKRCPTCNRYFFTLSVVLIPKNLDVLNGAEKSSKRSSVESRSSYSSARSSLSNASSLEVMTGSSSKRSSLESRSSISSLRSSLSSNSGLEAMNDAERSSKRSSVESSVGSRSSYSSARSSLSIDSSLEVMNDSSSKRSSVESSVGSRSSYGSARSSLSSNSGLGSNSLEKSSSQSPYLEEQSSESSYSSPFRSSLSYDSSRIEVSKSSAKSSLRSSLTLNSTDLDMPQSSEKSSYSSPFRSSLSNDSGVQKTSERSSGSSESWKSSLTSSYSSPFRSSSPLDSSSLQRPESSRRLSGISSLKSSSSLGSSFEVQEGEGGEGDEDASASRLPPPPPVPSSAPPSLQETYDDLSTPEVRSKGIKDALEEDGGGVGVSQDGSMDGGARGHISTRPSILQRSPSADQASDASHTPLTYSFPTIRTKLNLSRNQESDAQGTSISSEKMELRPTKSLPPPSSSSFSSSSSSWSLPPLSSSLGSSSTISSSGYTSPFRKSSSSSVSSIFSSRAAKSLSGEVQKPALRDSAATTSEKEAKNTTTSNLSSSSSSSSVSSIFSSRAVRSLSTEAQKSTLRDSAAVDSEKNKDTTSSISSSSSVSSIFRPKAVRSVSSEVQKSTLRDSAVTDSEKVKNMTSYASYSSFSSSYSSLASPSLDSTDGSSLSKSLPSLNKLDARLSAAPAKQDDEADLGVSKWKMDTSSLLSRRTDAKDEAAGRAERQDVTTTSSSTASGTPSHVLRMIRSVTSRSRPAAEATDEVTTSLSSSQEAASSSSASSSSLTTSKNTHTHHEAEQSKQGAAAQEVNQSSAPSEEREAGTTIPTGVNNRAGGSVSSPGSPSPSSDGGVRDASEGRGDMAVLGGEAEVARHSSTVTPPTGSHSEESQASWKLTPSASLRARLRMRTRLLATAIDEAGEEEHAGGGESSAGEQHGRAESGDKLYTPERQGEEQQAARPRVSLGARISARVGYLSGGRGSGERGEVQAEDSTKIDLKRRAGRSGTKNEASARGSDWGLDKGSGAAGAQQAATRAAAVGVEDESRSSGPAKPRRPFGLGDTGAPEGDGVLSGAASSGHDDPLPQQGSAAAAQERSQHTRWRHHRPIDSRSKEELSDPGCVPRAAADQGPADTSTGLPEAPGARTSTLDAPSATNSVPTAAASPTHLGQQGAAAGPRSPHHRWTKRNDTSDGPPPAFQSEAGSADDTSVADEGRPGTGGGRKGEDTRTPPPLPTSGPYAWRKRWRSVTEHTSSAAARHSPPEAKNTALSSASQKPEQPPPRGPPSPDEVQGGMGGNKALERPLHHTPLGALAIGRVPSVQEDDGDTGNNEDKAERRRESLDVARMRLRRTTEDTPKDTPEDTTEDVNTRLRRARERLRATVTTPTEEPPPSPARTNLTYLLTRVQGSEAAPRPTKVTTLSDGDDEVFEDSADEADDVQYPKQPETPPAGSPDRGLKAGGPEMFSSSTKLAQEEGDDRDTTIDEVDSVTRRRNIENDRRGRGSSDTESRQERHDGEPRRLELKRETTQQRQRNDPKRKQFFEEMQHTAQQEQDEARGEDEGTQNAPYEAAPKIVDGTRVDHLNEALPQIVNEPQEDHLYQATLQIVDDAVDYPYEASPQIVDDTVDYPYEAPQIVYGTGDTGDWEYEPGVGLCASHGQMLDLYCQDCGEWVCKDCLKVQHRPQPDGSCQVISAAEGVNQIKLTHSSFLNARSNTLEYFKEELRRIINECTGSIHLHRDNIRRLEAQIEEDRRLLRGIKSMRNLAKEKRKQVDYWEEVLKNNLSRIDESSSSQDVIRAVQETSGDILRKAMKAVSLEASAGVLLSPPEY